MDFGMGEEGSYKVEGKRAVEKQEDEVIFSPKHSMSISFAGHMVWISKVLFFLKQHYVTADVLHLKLRGRIAPVPLTQCA